MLDNSFFPNEEIFGAVNKLTTSEFDEMSIGKVITPIRSVDIPGLVASPKLSDL